MLHCASSGLLFQECEENELMHACICFLSEEMQHDVVVVYFIQRSILAVLKTKIKDFSNVEYFTDQASQESEKPGKPGKITGFFLIKEFLHSR